MSGWVLVSIGSNILMEINEIQMVFSVPPFWSNHISFHVKWRWNTVAFQIKPNTSWNFQILAYLEWSPYFAIGKMFEVKLYIYCVNLLVKKIVPTVCFPHMGILTLSYEMLPSRRESYILWSTLGTPGGGTCFQASQTIGVLQAPNHTYLG